MRGFHVIQMLLPKTLAELHFPAGLSGQGWMSSFSYIIVSPTVYSAAWYSQCPS
jgi:hypothetical protein